MVQREEQEYVEGRITIEIPNCPHCIDGAIQLPHDPVAWAEAMKTSADVDHDDPEISGNITAVVEMTGDGSGATILGFCPTADKGTRLNMNNELNVFLVHLSKKCAYKLGKALIASSQLND